MNRIKPKQSAQRYAKPMLEPIQFRFQPELIEALDQWANELNHNRKWPHLTRSDVVRGVLLWALKTKPNWEG